jgi:hypothetical protein
LLIENDEGKSRKIDVHCFPSQELLVLSAQQQEQQEQQQEQF